MDVSAWLRRRLRRFWFDPREARYHFIHIPKNAGQAVRDALATQRDVSLSDPYHYRYVDIAHSVGRQLRFFAVVRNPWSRTASRYQFARQSCAKWPANDPRRVFIENATFATFVKEQRILPIPEHPGQPWMGPLSSWFDQLDWVRDEQGQIACECLRMERLDEDLTGFLGRPLGLRRRNVTEERYDYRTMYTPELSDIVARLFQADIEHFGFEFEGTATRNTFGTA